MATKESVFKALRNALFSKKIAKALHDHTHNKDERLKVCERICREYGIHSWKTAGQLLEHLVHGQLTTTSAFGSWDSDETIAVTLGWPNRYYVKRAKKDLQRVGLIEIGLGKPVGHRAPHSHYRLTTLIGKLFRGVVKAIRKVAQSKKRAAKPNLVATRSSTKTPAHKAFKPEPISRVSQPVVGNSALDDIKRMLTGQIVIGGGRQ